MKLGPDGKYFFGKPMVPSDQGGLNAQFGVDVSKNLAYVNFGATLFWTGTPASEALSHAASIRETILKSFGTRTASKTCSSFNVIADKTTSCVVTRFTEKLSVFVASPEDFLFWAEQLEVAAKQFPSN